MRSSWLLAALLTGFANASGSTTSHKPGFIQAPGRTFTLDGERFRYIGTNAYWLQLLNEQDLDTTMSDIAALGIKVVRAWAFNDVTEIPETGPYFQVFHKNGTIEINTGANGLGRLDNIVKAAKNHDLHLIFTLTNNWFREATSDKHKHKSDKRGDEKDKPLDPKFRRNFLSNEYGGMDVYNKHFCKNATEIFHDDFYTKSDIVNAYNHYVTTVVKRYVDEPSILGWELANDPRCSSSLPASPSCTPQTITKWAAALASVVKQSDPNHLVSVGDGGFYCIGCPKLFPQSPSTKSPHTRRGYLTERDVGRRSVKSSKRRLSARQSKPPRCVTIGTPSGPDRKRDIKPRNNSPGPLFDGSFGIDTEDLTNIPDIDFATLQFIPDQIPFGPDGPIDLTDKCNIADSGIAWVELHSETGNTFNKPVAATAFGLLTNESILKFVPFNPDDEGKEFTACASADERADIMFTVFQAGTTAAVNVHQYLWGQMGLSSITDHGPIRRQTQYTAGTTGDPGYAIYQNDPGSGAAAGASHNSNGGGAGGG